MGDASRVEPFVGAWEVEARFPGAPGPMRGSASFEWALGGAFLIQRSDVEHPEAPFRQRYAGELSAGGGHISGRWEMGAEGGGWDLDFELDYRRR